MQSLLRQFHLTTIFILSICHFASAQNGYEITVKIDNFEEDVLYLAYHMGSKQYVADTVYRNDQDSFVFKGSEALDPGLYMLVIPPENSYTELLISEENQYLTVQTDKNDLVGKMSFSGSSPDNKLFYDYIQFLSEKNKQGTSLQEDESENPENEAKLAALSKEVVKFQRSMIEENPGTMFASFIKSSTDVDIPDFEGTEEEIRRKRFDYYKAHYFDNLDLTDDRLLRTPIVEQKITTYLDDLTYQMPDDVIESVDYIMSQMQEGSELYRFVLTTMVNKYATSKIMGFDAIYVHIVQEYYAKGKASWAEEDLLKRMTDNADRLAPTLIGKTAPNINLEQRDGFKTNLHAIAADYTVLFLYDYSLPENRGVMEKLNGLVLNKFGSKIKLVTVCFDFNQGEGCWQFVDSVNARSEYNYIGGENSDKIKELYAFKAPHRFLILDKNKEIIAKSIGLEYIMDIINDHEN